MPAERLAARRHRLAGSKPDVIFAELGDGILGEDGVQDILRDPELTAVGAAYVMASPDPVGCWGSVTNWLVEGFTCHSQIS